MTKDLCVLYLEQSCSPAIKLSFPFSPLHRTPVLDTAKSSRKTSLLAYAVSSLAVFVALVASTKLGAAGSTFFPLFLGAIAFSAWYGGLGPSLLALALSLLAIDMSLLHPKSMLSMQFDDLPRLSLFALVALLLI